MSVLDGPLSGFPTFRTADPDEARLYLGQILSPHALRLVHGHAQLDMCCRTVQLGDAILLYARYGAAVQLDPGSLEDFYLVGMPIAGASTIRSATWEVVSHLGIASVQSCLSPIRTQWDENCSKFSIKIPRSTLAWISIPVG